MKPIFPAANIVFETFGRTNFVLSTPTGKALVSFALDGEHNIMNALAAAAVGHSFGMSGSTRLGKH